VSLNGVSSREAVFLRCDGCQAALEAIDHMNRSGHLGQSMAGVTTLKTVTLAAAGYFYDGMGGRADPVDIIVFVGATISNIRHLHAAGLTAPAATWTGGTK
jgi:hypothetical protein